MIIGISDSALVLMGDIGDDKDCISHRHRQVGAVSRLITMSTSPREFLSRFSNFNGHTMPAGQCFSRDDDGIFDDKAG